MLRSLPETLLKYTCQGVVIRARYIRQLDNVHQFNLATQNTAKKYIRDINEKLKTHHTEMVKHAYGVGLKTLLADILKSCAEYQQQLVLYEIEQREQIIQSIAHFFQSPEIKTELTKHLIKSVTIDKKIRLEIPSTLKEYFKQALTEFDVEYITHENTTIAIKAGDQITYFDPELLIKDLRTLFHRPLTESYAPIFDKTIKDKLLNYINSFEVQENDNHEEAVNSDNEADNES